MHISLSFFNSLSHAISQHVPAPGQNPIILAQQSAHTAANGTIWNSIESNPQFSRFFAILHGHSDLRGRLDSTRQQLTLFAPTNDAIEFSDDFLRSRSHESLRNVLDYHLVPWPLSVTDLLCTPTLPTYYHPESLNGPQRMNVDVQFGGFLINDNVNIKDVAIKASNGLHSQCRHYPPAALSVDNPFHTGFAGSSLRHLPTRTSVYERSR